MQHIIQILVHNGLAKLQTRLNQNSRVRVFPVIKKTELNLSRYKYIVNVVIGEKRGEGVRMGTRCFYDADTDNMAQDTFVNVRKDFI